jgi:hypothetical protein
VIKTGRSKAGIGNFKTVRPIDAPCVPTQPIIQLHDYYQFTSDKKAHHEFAFLARWGVCISLQIAACALGQGPR